MTLAGSRRPPSAEAQEIRHNLVGRSDFLGRESEKTEVHNALLARSRLVIIDGLGGVGKSSLALEVAHECAKARDGIFNSRNVASFDAVIWTSAKDRPLVLNDILDAIARTLDFRGVLQAQSGEKLVAVQDLLRRQRCLLIVDNLETVTDEEVVCFLRDLPETSQALITTRKREQLDAQVISMGRLSIPECIELIRRRAQSLHLAAVVKARDDELIPLCEETGGLPLAVKWAVGQMAQKGQSLATVQAFLRIARGDLFRDIFDRAWSFLSDDAKRVLMVMPLFASPADLEAIEHTSDIHDYALVEALGSLTELWLLEPSYGTESIVQAPRYSVHPLTRSFAEACLHDVAGLARDARLRMASYYARRCYDLGGWGEHSNFSWFETELANISAVLDWAKNNEQWDTIITIFRGVFYFLGTVGYWEDRIRFGRLCLEAATKSGNSFEQARAHHALGWVLRPRGQLQEARDHLREAIRLYRELGHIDWAILSMIPLAETFISAGDLAGAQQTVNDALSLKDGSHQETMFQGIYSAQGDILSQSGDYLGAQEFYLKAYAASVEEGIGPTTSSRLVRLGRNALALNQIEEAQAYFEDALSASERFDRLDNASRAKLGLAKVAAGSARVPEARMHLLEARDTFVRLAMKDELAEAEALLLELDQRESTSHV